MSGGVEPAGLRDVDGFHRLEEMAGYEVPHSYRLVEATRRLKADLSNEGAEVVISEDDATIAERIPKKIANLLYVAVDDIDAIAPIRNYGIESMVAAELRNWLYRKVCGGRVVVRYVGCG